MYVVISFLFVFDLCGCISGPSFGVFVSHLLDMLYTLPFCDGVLWGLIFLLLVYTSSHNFFGGMTSRYVCYLGWMLEGVSRDEQWSPPCQNGQWGIKAKGDLAVNRASISWIV
jgi:hypothetical protein